MEEDMVMNHEHDISDPGHTHPYTDTYPHSSYTDLPYGSAYGNKLYDKTTASSTTGISVTGVSAGYRSGAETRPKNMNVIFIMRVY